MPRYQFWYKFPDHPEMGVPDFYMDIENKRLEQIVRDSRGDWDVALKKLAQEYLEKIHSTAAVEIVNYRKIS